MLGLRKFHIDSFYIEFLPKSLQKKENGDRTIRIRKGERGCEGLHDRKYKKFPSHTNHMEYKLTCTLCQVIKEGTGIVTDL